MTIHDNIFIYRNPAVADRSEEPVFFIFHFCVAVHVLVLCLACLFPDNSISNVVVSVTIHDDTDVFVYSYRRCSKKKNMKPLCKVVQIVRYTWVLMSKPKPNHPAADSLRIVPQEGWN